MIISFIQYDKAYWSALSQRLGGDEISILIVRGV